MSQSVDGLTAFEKLTDALAERLAAPTVPDSLVDAESVGVDAESVNYLQSVKRDPR